MMTKLGVFTLLLGGLGCATTQTTVLSLQDISCQSCGNAVVQKLNETPSIESANFMRQHAEVQVAFDPEEWSPERLAETVTGFGYAAVAESGKGSYRPFPEYPEGADVVWIADSGQPIPEERAVPGKWTVVDFYAPWCGPCRKVDDFLVGELEAGASFAVRKVNVVDWDSPVMQQLGSALSTLPTVEVYDPTGKRVGVVSGLDLPLLKQMLPSKEEGP